MSEWRGPAGRMVGIVFTHDFRGGGGRCVCVCAARQGDVNSSSRRRRRNGISRRHVQKGLQPYSLTSTLGTPSGLDLETNPPG